MAGHSTLESELVQRSRETADGKAAPAGPQMMSDVAWITDDWAFAHPWEWVELVAAGIVQAAVILGSALLAGTAAIAGSHLFAASHPTAAWFSLAVAAAFSVVFLGSSGAFVSQYRTRGAAREAGRQ
jgi:hypothetical protein